MKFSVKHALVVAIAFLGICVVATGTVVAVTMSGNREAAAANWGTLTVLVINVPALPGADPRNETPRSTNNFATGSATNPNHDGVMVETSSFTLGFGEGRVVAAPPGHTFHAFHRPNYNPATGATTWVSALLHSPLTDVGMVGFRHGIRLGWSSHRRQTLIIYADNLLENITVGVSVRPLEPGELDVVEVGHTVTSVVRSAATGTATTTVTHELFQGFHVIPDPVNQNATFRGWALEPGGNLMFPRGLPVPVFSTKRLYAVHV